MVLEDIFRKQEVFFKPQEFNFKDENSIRQIKQYLKSGNIFALKVSEIGLDAANSLRNELDLHSVAFSKGWCIPCSVADVLKNHFSETWDYFVSEYNLISEKFPNPGTE